jgi:alkylation response protein AidB-like acyl-CoA dehydrogenase
MRAGEIQGVFSLTEPQSGSDVTAIQTTATRTSSGFVLNGEKAWILRAESADFFGVYAQTKPGSGAKGIAMFLVNADSPGLQKFSFDLFAGRAFGMGGFTLKNVEIPESAILIEPGVALRSALTAIDVARATVASMCCGLLQRGLDEALTTTSKRRAFGRTIGEFQGVQWMLADIATDLEASRALANAALDKIDKGEPATLQAAHAKKFASRACLKGLVDCMQVMGANGARTESVSSRHLGYAKLAQYLDGTTEIQNVVIARHLYKTFQK